MQSKEVMKKLADNYETLVFVSKRYPSSMSRLKNLLMLEGVSETSARSKIADLETEFNLPNRLAEEQEQQLAAWKRKVKVLEWQKADEKTPTGFSCRSLYHFLTPQTQTLLH